MSSVAGSEAIQAANRAQIARAIRWPLLSLLLVLTALAATSHGQRVQIPNSPPGVLSAPAPPPQTFASPGVITPPPAFDAYSAGSPFGPPPPSIPYQPGPSQGAPMAAPYAAQPAFGQAAPQVYGQPPPLEPSGFPLSWEPGTYGFQQGDGSLVRYTKFCKELDFEYTHLFGGNSSNDLELNRIEISNTFTYPLFGNIDAPLLITPGFVFNFFDDSSLEPFPGEVYDAYLDVAWYPQVSEGFGFELGLRTGVWTDFEEVSSDSVRILGRGLVVMRVGPTAEFLIGAVYLDRRRVKLLPAGGIRCRPSPDLEINAVFPNPSVRRRFNTTGTTDWWGFVAGEYGGGSWTHDDQPNGFDYNDLRASAGVEFETQSQVQGFFEVGFVFDRHFYLAGPVAPEFDETVMLRAGLRL